jgi:hypothetical protein
MVRCFVGEGCRKTLPPCSGELPRLACPGNDLVSAACVRALLMCVWVHVCVCVCVRVLLMCVWVHVCVCVCVCVCACAFCSCVYG